MVRLVSLAVAALLLAYMVFAIVRSRRADNGQTCLGIRVELTDGPEYAFLKEEDIREMLNRSHPDLTGKPMEKINTHRIENDLMRNQALANVEVYKTPSGLLRIDVRQKHPVLRVIGARGNYYVDERGTIMPASRRYTAYVPLAGGYIEKDLAMTDLYEFALFLHKNAFWNNQIEQIYVHPDGDVDLIPRVGNHRIALGGFDDFEEKLENLRLFYEQAIPKVGWDKYSVVSLKYKNQIVCTKKIRQ